MKSKHSKAKRDKRKKANKPVDVPKLLAGAIREHLPMAYTPPDEYGMMHRMFGGKPLEQILTEHEEHCARIWWLGEV